MELAVEETSVPTEPPPSPVPMEVEPETAPVEEKPPNPDLTDAPQTEGNKETNPEPNPDDKESPQDEQNNNETKDVLKGILKHKHIYGLDKKTVDFDMEIERIPYNSNDYTVDIQIVKEIPKRVVSYRELFKKQAEERAAKEKAMAEEEEEEEPVDTKAFSQLVLKEPPIHHSTNDIDVTAMRTLKALTVQNEKNGDIASICRPDVSREGNETDSSSNLNGSKVVEKGKFSVTPVDEFTECHLKTNPLFVSQPFLNDNTIDNKITSTNNPVNSNSDVETANNLDSLTEQENWDKSADHLYDKDADTRDPFDNEGSEIQRDRNKKSEDRSTEKWILDIDEEEFNCDQEYFYCPEEDSTRLADGNRLEESDGNNSISDEILSCSQLSKSTLTRVRPNDDVDDDLSTKYCSKQNTTNPNMSIGNLGEDSNQTLLANDLINELKIPKGNYVSFAQNDLAQDKLERLKEEKAIELSKERVDVSNNAILKESSSDEDEESESGTELSWGEALPKIHKGQGDLYNNIPEMNDEASLDWSNIDKGSRTRQREVDEPLKSQKLVNGYSSESSRDMGVQTDLDFSFPSHCQQCTCSLKADTVHPEENAKWPHGINSSAIRTASDNTLTLATDAEQDYQDYKSMTDSWSEGNFKDFSQSTSLDFSTSLSMESFEMDDNAIRIDAVNGWSSYDTNL